MTAFQTLLVKQCLVLVLGLLIGIGGFVAAFRDDAWRWLNVPASLFDGYCIAWLWLSGRGLRQPEGE